MRLSALFKPSLYLALLAILAPGLQPTVTAQPVGDTVVTAGLGVPANAETGADPLVYLTWWPTGDAVWQPETYAVYSKPGEPSDPGAFTLAAVVRPQTSAIAAGQSIAQAIPLGENRADLATNINGLYDKIIPVAGMGLNEKLAAIVQVSQVDPESAETLSLLTRRHPAAALAAGVAFVEPIDEGVRRTYEIRSCPGAFSGPADCTVVSGRVVVTGGEFKRLPAPGRPYEVPFVDDSGNPDPRGNLNVPLRWATPGDLRERSFFQFGYDVYRVEPELAESNNWGEVNPDAETFFNLMQESRGRIIRVNERPILTDRLFGLDEAGDLSIEPEKFFIIDDNDRYDNSGTVVGDDTDGSDDVILIDDDVVTGEETTLPGDVYPWDPSNLGGIPFNDGDRYYYFVAARDLLGRPGELSPGTPITICFRIPPQAPGNVQVENHFTYDAPSDTQTQVFRVSWDEAETREHGPGIKEYWVYRWESIEQMQALQALPQATPDSGNLTGGRVAVVPADTLEYIDNQDAYPFITYSQQGDLETPAVVVDDKANKTYWYSVRAVDASVCSGNVPGVNGNVSGNSGPAYGVLRDRVGPAAPDGNVQGSCVIPTVATDGSSLEPGGGSFDSALTYLALTVTRLDDRIEWAEIFLGPLGDERSFLGRIDFPESGTIELSKKIRNDLLLDQEQATGTIFVRVGTAVGSTSDFAEASFQTGIKPDQQTGNYVQRRAFVAAIDEESPCDTHQPYPDGGAETSTVTPVDINLSFVPTTREYKLYRRVNGGPRTLIRQGLADYDTTPGLTVEDIDLPLNGGRVCYFLQVFDLQGNSSVLTRIGCITIAPRRQLPAPLLSPVEPVGETPQTGAARIKWFSPPAGVERFEVAIRTPGEGLPGADISDGLRLDLPPEGPRSSPDLSVALIGFEKTLYRSYLTSRPGANFESGPAYDVLWDRNLATGVEHAIRIRAIGAGGGATSPWSNEVSFTWSPEVDFSQPFDPGDCVVPWPVRGLPGTDGDFAAALPPEGFEVGLEAAYGPENPNGTVAYNGGAVRVGLVDLGQIDLNIDNNWDDLPESYSSGGIFPLPRSEAKEASDLVTAFYERSNGEPLPAFMLYRYQVPNATWPTVSGDVYQVSPLIDGLASVPSTFQGLPVHAVHDPYVFLIPINGTQNTYHLWVKDTQPVIQGAGYRYLVVRFDARGEIAQVIPLDPVTAN